MTLVLVLMAAAAFASGFSLRISDSLLPQIADDFGTTIGTAAAIITAYAVPYGMTQAFAGLLANRLGKCQAVAATCAASCVLVLLSAYAQSLNQLTIARLLAAPAAASIVPLGMAYVGDTVPYERRQPVLARFLAGQMFGMMTGQVAGGIIGDHFGWRSAFLVLSAVFACAGVALATQLKHNPWTARIAARQSGSGMLAEYRALLSTGWRRFLIGTVFVEGAIFFAGLTYVAADLRLRFDLSFSLIGLAVACFSIGSIFYAAIVPRLIARLGERGLVACGGVAGMIGFLALAGMPVWWIAPPAVALLGFGYYNLHNTLQTNATQMMPEARGTALSGFSSVLFLGQSAGVAIAAPVIDHFGAVPIFIGVAILWPVLAIWIRWRLGQREPARA